MLSDFVVINRGINNNHYYRIKILVSTSTWIRYYCTIKVPIFGPFGMIMKWFVIFHLHILKAMKVILPKYLLLSEKGIVQPCITLIRRILFTICNKIILFFPIPELHKYSINQRYCYLLTVCIDFSECFWEGQGFLFYSVNTFYIEEVNTKKKSTFVIIKFDHIFLYLILYI